MVFNLKESNNILGISLIVSIILVVLTYFLYRPFLWPLGAEAAGCLISVMMLTASAYLLWKFRERFISTLQQRNVSIGLLIGILWTIEISINNFLQPDLPLRDNIDNIFFTIIAILIFINAVRDAYNTNAFYEGLKSGFWSGFASGAIACLTALIIIVFGMKYILHDPLNMKEWADVSSKVNYPGMEVYFAYQTFAGAIMHLFILGALMGIMLGVTGGLTGKLLLIIRSLNRR